LKKGNQLTNGIILAPNRSIALVLMLIDKVGSLLRRRKQRPSRIDSILIVFFGSFGDGLMFTSILESLRKQKPQARIDALVSSDVGAILKGSPYPSNIIVTEMRSGREYPSKIPGLVTTMRNLGVIYDVALCLRSTIDNGVLPLFISGISRYNVGFSTGGFSFCLDEVVKWRPGIHETEHFLDVVRTICPQCQLGAQELFYDVEATRSSLNEKCMSLGLEKTTEFLVVHPGSKLIRRSLSIQRWRKILADLVEQTTKIILVTGISSEKIFYDSIGVSHPRIVPTFGVFNIPELSELIKLSSGVVTVETFVSHLAGFAGVPAVAFWTGSTDVRQWRPVGKNVTVASVSPPCSPCFKWCDKPICMDHDTQIVTEIFQAK
jgi:ADP-heptose:LPS heptosyltransferase